ncbi:MAG: hypothetical protein IJO60_08585, partial [Agathobacter sp.]|nr:hypothetical protein [Agathobacter sp.]
MVVTEIVLIIIGVVAFVASFFVTEKLSQKDLDQITLMSEADLKTISEKQLKEVKVQVENSVEEIIDESLEITKRGLERETNKKIMAVSEYSDTVMEEINKTHNEIMFLYSMLNDKQAETADMVSDLQRLTKQVREMDIENVTSAIANQSEKLVEQMAQFENAQNVQGVQIVSQEPVIEPVADEKEEKTLNKNEQILLLY